MDRVRKLWTGSEEQAYEPLVDGDQQEVEDAGATGITQSTFSYIDYSIFLLLGVSMLWAWNMMLAAGPYFQMRFRDNQRIFDNFQAAEISVATVTNLVSMLILTTVQANASYPKRIVTSLCINMTVFALMAASTSFKTSAGGYFGFLMFTIFVTSLATALCQNGIFAFASGFGRPEYLQSIMTGQAVAGVLPCIIKIASVLSLKPSHDEPKSPRSDDTQPPQSPPPVPPRSAMAYFLTATGIAVVTLVAFAVLLARHRERQQTQNVVEDESPDAGISSERKSISLLYLFRKLFWLAAAVFTTFAVTMIFPVYTQRIVSVRPPKEQSALLQPPSFIPLAFLFWNTGDLIGRLLTAVPALSLARLPKTLFALALSRVVFIGMYHLCNISGRGASVDSDVFYLVVVQLLFGLSNGFLGSTCMIGAGEWVEPDEREAAGGFMALCLVGGLTVGSLASFSAASV